MERRKLLGFSAAAIAAVVARRPAKASVPFGYILSDRGAGGIKHWLVPDVGGAIVRVSAVIRDGSFVPAGATLTVTASVSGNQAQFTIPAGARSGYVAAYLAIGASTDLIRWSATYSGMAPAEVDVAIFID